MTDKDIEQRAVYLANNIDSSSLTLLRKFCFGNRGSVEFWQRVSSGSSLYSFYQKRDDDTTKLTLWQPYNFIKDFKSSYQFDTSRYNEFRFLKIKDTIVRIIEINNGGQEVIKDTSISVKQIFPDQNPFQTLSNLTAIQNRFKFIGSFYRNDIGDFISFWLSPKFKLTYLPDTLKMNNFSKKYWLEEFSKGKQIKQYWSLINVYNE
ncbi:hypothetical protein QTN47_25440 [Danxiaibacter flavus]|uniref:GLPGLI family protein n=1 Tax=Danxiaibacter flavus TaxID=3049108 RepID=A0ABV3ZM11_9BACT|nr:hypothetical protein QNM32_25445 [Chitinophagaceae bacterium DXS]